MCIVGKHSHLKVCMPLWKYNHLMVQKRVKKTNKQTSKTREKENGVSPTGNEASQYGAMTSYKFTSKDLCLVTHDRQRGDSLSKL